MTALQKLVQNQLITFCDREECFTALDISNAIKSSGFPCRHRDVRDIVVKSFKDNGFDAETNGRIGYGTTQIDVTLASGDRTAANLYHPAGMSYIDIDDAYPQHKREQLALLAPTATIPPLTLATQNPVAFASVLGNNLKDRVKGFFGK